jgi:hypothetical protein
MIKKYRVITVCGSYRCREEFKEAEYQLTLQGYIVLPIGAFDPSTDKLTDQTKSMLLDMQKRKIDLSDEIFVVNKNSVIDQATIDNISYAARQRKKVSYLEPVNNGVN